MKRLPASSLPASSLRLAALLAASVIVASAGSTPASAMGNETVNTPTCKRGEVYDKKTKKCVKQTGSNLTDENLADYAYALAKAERYDEALSVLDTMKDPNTAEALNYRGYATRKLGRVEEGIGYYLRSVKLDPRYAKVREYLGEAYVQRGDKGLARQQLAAIEGICGRTCEEYEDLAAALD